MHSVRIASSATAHRRSLGHSFHNVLPLARRLVVSAAVLAPVLGCGNQYRPVVTAISPVGPAVQPSKYVIAVSQPGNISAGLITIVDVSGDGILANANGGARPYYLNLNYSATGTASNGYILNADNTISYFPIAVALTPTSTALQSSNVETTTLPPAAGPTSVFTGSATSTYVTEAGRSSVAQLTVVNSALTLRQELPIAAGYTPVYIAGINGGPRAYSINQSATAGAPGQVAAIESTTNTISTTIPVGVTPVYGVMTTDARRAFILNQGSNTVSVVNAQSNIADVTTPTIPVGVAPVWADLAPTRTELLVANAGTGTSPGSVSVISIPLCSSATLPSNPNCDPNNPVDAVGFGTVLANIAVGVQPNMITVLQDGSQAYVANYADSTVSAINLNTNTVTATIPVAGRPIWIASTTGTPTGKVYVITQDSVSEPGFTVAPTSSLMTIIRTDSNQVESYVDLQGKGVSVRLSTP